jgi:hypothetical protein
MRVPDTNSSILNVNSVIKIKQNDKNLSVIISEENNDKDLSCELSPLKCE